MGIQTNIKLRGTVENVIYYQWNGIHCMRTVPQKVRQTKATKKAATDFGVAVKSSALVRAAFQQLMPKTPAERSVIYTTDNAFRKWLQTNPLSNSEEVNGIPFFDGLSFNEETNFRNIFRPGITISRGEGGGLLIRWPEFNPVTFLRAPTGTVKTIIQYIAATVDMTGKEEPRSNAIQIAIPYINEELEGQEFPLKEVTAAKSVALVGMSARYFKDDLQTKPVNMLRWKPAGIIKGFFN